MGKEAPPTNSLTEHDKWVDDHYEYLVRYASRYLRSKEQAFDIVQDTFLAAVSKPGQFEGRSSVRTWLTGILRHKIIDQFRKNTKEEVVDLPTLEGDSLEQFFDSNEHYRSDIGPRDWATDPARVLEGMEFASIVEECLKAVPMKLRQIFLLREIEGLPRDEIATELKLSSNHIGVLLHRVRLGLQKCVQGHWNPVGGKS